MEDNFRVRTVLPGVPAFLSVWLKLRVTEELSFFLLLTVRPIFACAKVIVRKLDGMTVNLIRNWGELQEVKGEIARWLG